MMLITMKQETQVEPPRTATKLFEPRLWNPSMSARRYEKTETVSFIHMHTHGHFGCITKVVERRNEKALTKKGGVITSVFPTTHGDDPMVLTTYRFADSDDAFSAMHLASDYGMRFYERLRTRVIDFNRFVAA